MVTTSHHRQGHQHATRHRAAVVATGALALAGAGAGAGAANAAELPSSADVPSQVNDSAEYGGYVAGSVEAFFQLPPDQAILGSAAAGSTALCLILPTSDDTCVI